MENKHEKISAWMDGEAEDASLHDPAWVAGDATARAAWARYHLIGDVLRDAAVSVAPPDFAREVSERIGHEPAILSLRAAAPERPRRPLLGFAIAASVAAVAVLGVSQMQHSGEPVAEVSAPAPPAVTTVAATAPATAAKDKPNPLADPFRSHRRLNSYLVKFNEQRSSLGVPSVNPYVRIVGFEAE